MGGRAETERPVRLLVPKDMVGRTVRTRETNPKAAVVRPLCKGARVCLLEARAAGGWAGETRVGKTGPAYTAPLSLPCSAALGRRLNSTKATKGRVLAKECW